MVFERLRKNHFGLLVLVLMGIFLSVVAGFFLSQARYKQTQDMKLVEGTISYKLADMNVVAMYQKDDKNYYSIDTIPSSGYILNKSKSYCETGGNKIDANIKLEDDGLYFEKVVNKGTKCYVYFDKVTGKTMENILANYEVGNRGSFSTNYTNVTSKTIFIAEDWLGTSKYFAGAPTDNYVKFGGFYWRIIRMNGNKTTRLIYAGDANVIDELTASERQNVLSNGYNDSATNYMTVKNRLYFKYPGTNPEQSISYAGLYYTIGNLIGTSTPSYMYNNLSEWFENNLKTKYYDYIDGSSGFCGDRSIFVDESGLNKGTISDTRLYFGAYTRIYANKNPSLKCENNDIFSSADAKIGNRALTNSVGLITLDEASLAGLVASTKIDYNYLNNEIYCWTMSPFFYGGNSDIRLGVIYNYGITNSNVTGQFGMRPVINLKANLNYKGTGTWNDPFVPILT